MRMRIAAIMLAACLVALGGLLFAGIAPEWLVRSVGGSPGGLEAIGLVVTGMGLFRLGRRGPRVRHVLN